MWFFQGRAVSFSHFTWASLKKKEVTGLREIEKWVRVLAYYRTNLHAISNLHMVHTTRSDRPSCILPFCESWHNLQSLTLLQHCFCPKWVFSSATCLYLPEGLINVLALDFLKVYFGVLVSSINKAEGDMYRTSIRLRCRMRVLQGNELRRVLEFMLRVLSSTLRAEWSHFKEDKLGFPNLLQDTSVI